MCYILSERLTKIPIGSSSSDVETVVKPFYEYWMAFSTVHEFFSADKYDLREAENRQVRRIMEKENKKERDASRKQYNADIRVFRCFSSSSWHEIVIPQPT
jgi:DnaJ homolog subfamily A member 5